MEVDTVALCQKPARAPEIGDKPEIVFQAFLAVHKDDKDMCEQTGKVPRRNLCMPTENVHWLAHPRRRCSEAG